MVEEGLTREERDLEETPLERLCLETLLGGLRTKRGRLCNALRERREEPPLPDGLRAFGLAALPRRFIKSTYSEAKYLCLLVFRGLFSQKLRFLINEFFIQLYYAFIFFFE